MDNDTCAIFCVTYHNDEEGCLGRYLGPLRGQGKHVAHYDRPLKPPASSLKAKGLERPNSQCSSHYSFDGYLFLGAIMAVDSNHCRCTVPPLLPQTTHQCHPNIQPIPNSYKLTKISCCQKDVRHYPIRTPFLPILERRVSVNPSSSISTDLRTYGTHVVHCTSEKETSKVRKQSQHPHIRAQLLKLLV